ncbi:MAG: Ig-like domain-containing protein [Candidatus Marinimicrobia bacterium]|nr:Ig-like domain-containing protein [Candidatus Neomarinimicrobiota bacterium]
MKGRNPLTAKTIYWTTTPGSIPTSSTTDANGEALACLTTGITAGTAKVKGYYGTSDLGTKKYSFIDQLPFALTAGIRYKLTPLYSLQVNADLYSAKKYQFVFSIWSKVAQTARL